MTPRFVWSGIGMERTTVDSLKPLANDSHTVSPSVAPVAQCKSLEVWHVRTIEIESLRIETCIPDTTLETKKKDGTYTDTHTNGSDMNV